MCDVAWQKRWPLFSEEAAAQASRHGLVPGVGPALYQVCVCRRWDQDGILKPEKRGGRWNKEAQLSRRVGFFLLFTELRTVLARCALCWLGAMLAQFLERAVRVGVSLARLWIEVREGERRHGASHPTAWHGNLHELQKLVLASRQLRTKILFPGTQIK